MEAELKLLVVEDDPTHSGEVSRALDEQGVRQCVHRSPNVEDAKACLRREHYDVVLLDLELPGVSGLDAVMDVQATAPELPIVGLSRDLDSELAHKSVDLGAEDCVAKGRLQYGSIGKSLFYAIERHRHKIKLFRNNDVLLRSLQSARQEAESDPLTGLANRRGLERRLDGLAGRADATLAALVIDINRFRSLSERHGYPVGEAALREAAARSLCCLQARDLLGRVEGDTFLALLPRPTRREALVCARGLMAKLGEEAFSRDGHRFHLGASVALLDITGGANVTQVLERAEPLLQRARGCGGARLECEWPESGEGSAASAEELQPARFQGAPRPILELGAAKPLGHVYAFNLADSGIGFQAIAPALEQWLAQVRRGWYWEREGDPGCLLHLDLEPGCLTPGFSDILRNAFAQDERSLCVITLTTQWPEPDREWMLQELRLARDLGFQLAVRGVGGQQTVLETLLALEPQWIRLHPNLTLGLLRFGTKARALERTVALIRPLRARLVAEDRCDELAQLTLGGLGIYAYCPV